MMVADDELFICSLDGDKIKSILGSRMTLLMHPAKSRGIALSTIYGFKRMKATYAFRHINEVSAINPSLVNRQFAKNSDSIAFSRSRQRHSLMRRALMWVFGAVRNAARNIRRSSELAVEFTQNFKMQNITLARALRPASSLLNENLRLQFYLNLIRAKPLASRIQDILIASQTVET